MPTDIENAARLKRLAEEAVQVAPPAPGGTTPAPSAEQPPCSAAPYDQDDLFY